MARMPAKFLNHSYAVLAKRKGGEGSTMNINVINWHFEYFVFAIHHHVGKPVYVYRVYQKKFTVGKYSLN